MREPTKEEIVEFDPATGAVAKIGVFGVKTRMGSFSEIADFRFIKERMILSHNNCCVVTWRDPFKPVLRVSPIYSKPEHLDLFRNEIVPLLEAMLSEYRALHPEEYTTIPAEAGAISASSAETGRFFCFDGAGYARSLWGGPLFLLSVAVALGIWLVVASYGLAGTLTLAASLLLALFLFYAENKKIVISPRNKIIAVYSGLWHRVDEFGFEAIERFVIRSCGPLRMVSIFAKERYPVTVCLTFTREDAKASLREIGAITGLDILSILTVE